MLARETEPLDQSGNQTRSEASRKAYNGWIGRTGGHHEHPEHGALRLQDTYGCSAQKARLGRPKGHASNPPINSIPHHEHVNWNHVKARC